MIILTPKDVREDSGVMKTSGLRLIWMLAMALPCVACQSPREPIRDGGLESPDAATEAPDAGEETPDAGVNEPRGQWAPPPPVNVPPLPAPPDYSDYPVDSLGRPIISQSANINLVVRQTPDALSARDRCANVVTHCFEPGVRSLDACMLSAPRCGTAQPWTESGACCAEACWTSYAALRTAGVDPLTATLDVLYNRPSCMPGVDTLLGGAP